MAGNRAGMTVADWMLTLLILSIPLVNIVMAIVWACGVGNNTRTNFCRAFLLWIAIIIVMYIVAFGDLFSSVTGWFAALF